MRGEQSLVEKGRAKVHMRKVSGCSRNIFKGILSRKKKKKKTGNHGPITMASLSSFKAIISHFRFKKQLSKTPTQQKPWVFPRGFSWKSLRIGQDSKRHITVDTGCLEGCTNADFHFTSQQTQFQFLLLRQRP